MQEVELLGTLSPSSASVPANSGRAGAQRSQICSQPLRQLRECSVARGELLTVQPHTLGEVDVEVAKRDVAVRQIDIASVLETTSGDKHGKLLIAVGMGIAHAAAEHDRGCVEEWLSVDILGRGQLVQKSSDFLHVGVLNGQQLIDLFLLLPRLFREEGRIVKAELIVQHNQSPGCLLVLRIRRMGTSQRSKMWQGKDSASTGRLSKKISARVVEGLLPVFLVLSLFTSK